MAKILVAGTGVAGEATALHLARAGWQVEVAEIAPAPRTGGQTVHLCGRSAAALDRLGLLQECRRRLVEQRGIAWVHAAGHRFAELPVEAIGVRGFVSSEELLRSDLVDLLHAAASAAGVSHVLSETAEALERVPSGVRVSFRGREPQVVDLVVGADGTHSRVGSLLLGPEEQSRRRLGLDHAWPTVQERPETPALEGWSLVHDAPGRLVAEARPGHRGEQEAGFTPPARQGPALRGREARVARLEQAFAEVGRRGAELLDAAASAPDLAMDSCDQLRVPRWFSGRVVLLGDSVWGASPLGGLGTSLALAGAETLVDALGAASALERYESQQRPVGRSTGQRLPQGRMSSTYAPSTRWGVTATAALVRTVPTRSVDAAVTHLVTR